MAQIQAYLQTFDVRTATTSTATATSTSRTASSTTSRSSTPAATRPRATRSTAQDAIWSHRWYAQLHTGCPYGRPACCRHRRSAAAATRRAQPIPNNPTGVWVCDYTIQPENGGLGVFAHEYGHDLGLPDLYDTSGNTGGAENSTGFWTLMSSGANIGDGGPTASATAGRHGRVGEVPARLARTTSVALRRRDVAAPAGPGGVQHASGRRACSSSCPTRRSRLELGDPFDGAALLLLSGAGDDLDNTMTKRSLAARRRGDGQGAVRHRGRLGLRVPRGLDATAARRGRRSQTNLSDRPPTTRAAQHFGTGITGTSGGAWVDADRRRAAGRTPTDVLRRLPLLDRRRGGRARLPGRRHRPSTACLGDRRGRTSGWTFDGFRVTTGSETRLFANYYLAENRQYRRLRHVAQDGVQLRLPQHEARLGGDSTRISDGVLINYWDTSHSDNNVGDHPGEGLILPIDAHPEVQPLVRTAT